MKAAFFLLVWGVAFAPAHAGVVVYPAPAAEPLSSDYDLRIATHRVPVYTARVLDPQMIMNPVKLFEST